MKYPAKKLKNEFKSSVSTEKRINRHGEIIYSKKTLFEEVILPENIENEIVGKNNPEDTRKLEVGLENDWIAENLVDFFGEIALLYDEMTDENKEWKKGLGQPEEHNGYPDKILYRWKETHGETPKVLRVDNYIEKVIQWIRSCVNDEDMFPTDEEVPFKKDFRDKIAPKIMQRMSRIFTIILSNPTLSGLDDRISSQNSKTFMNLTTNFIAFGLYWELLDKDQIRSTKHFAKIEMRLNKEKMLFYREVKTSLIKLIEEKDECDEQIYFLYITEQEVKTKMRLGKRNIEDLIEIGTRDDWLKVVERGNKRRLCYKNVRKLPHQFL